MRFKSLENLLRQRAPEYAERIEQPDTAPLHLKIRLDDGTGVLLGWLSKLPGVWVIIDPRPPSLPDSEPPAPQGHPVVVEQRERQPILVPRSPRRQRHGPDPLASMSQAGRTWLLAAL